VGWLVAGAVVILLFGFAAFFGAPYVPSRKKYIDRAFRHLYELGPRDVLVDIGSGDGVVLRAATRFGAKAIGYEINPVLVFVSRLLSLHQPLVTIIFANFWMAKLPDDTTVVYAFSVLRDNKRLIKKMQREADRLHHHLDLICYASPLADIRPVGKYEAYYRYTFYPLQGKKA